MAVSSKLATFWSYASTGAITLCALALTYRAFNQDSPTPPTAPLTVVDNWVDYTKTGERVGSKSAKSVVVVFSDYQCPYCKLMHERLDEVLARRPNDVAVVYRHWPLSNIHPHAFAAAVTASCAAKQQRFAEANRALYSLADSLSLVSQNEIAKRVGVEDLEAFDSCDVR